MFEIEYRKRIAQEDADASHIESDLNMISIANQMHYEECGWEQLKNRCFTSAAKSIISAIEIHKYRIAEYHAGMM